MFSESWYPKLDDLGAESEFKPQKLSFIAEKISLPVTTSPVITSPPPSLGYSHLISAYKSPAASVPTLAQSPTITTAVSQLESPPTYSALVLVTSVHPISEPVVTAPSVVRVSTGLPLVYPVTTVPPVILITAPSPVVTPALTTVTPVTTVSPTVTVSTTPVVTTVSTSVIKTAPTFVVPSVITTGPPTLPPAVGVGIPVAATPPPPAVLVILDTDFEQDIMAEEKSFIPPPFKEVATDDAEQWVHHFENYCEYRALDDGKKLALSKVLLTQGAATWLDSLSDPDRATWAALKAKFLERYLTPSICILNQLG